MPLQRPYVHLWPSDFLLKTGDGGEPVYGGHNTSHLGCQQAHQSAERTYHGTAASLSAKQTTTETLDTQINPKAQHNRNKGAVAKMTT